jgi:hypothetical protein
MPQFEVFTRRARPAVAQAMVTVQKGGSLGLNQAALELLGAPDAVLLLFDPQERVIGLRPVARTEPNSYPVQKQPSGKGAVVAGRAFTQFYGIPADQARRYVAQLYGDVLGVDLNQQAVELDVGRVRSAPASASER